MRERSQRAIDIMRSLQAEERRVSRVHITVPASITCPAVHCLGKLAILRDLSTDGAFFYAEMDAKEKAAVILEFVIGAFGKSIRMQCEGQILRVERYPKGAATGFAVQFTRCNMMSAEPS